MVYINDEIGKFDLQQALDAISPQRRQQALKYKFEQGQRLCVAAYLLLKLVGHPELHFSLSHCKEAAVCVLSRQPIGIDVESVGRYRDSVARYAMSDAELQQIQQAANPEVEFVRLWTMKESLLKLTGEGINDQMKQVLSVAARYRFTTTEVLQKNYIYTVCEL